MSMKNKLLGGAVLLMSAFSLNEVQATDCAVPPTCAQLGYTMKKADCGEYPVMRCPFALSDDNQVFCEGTVKVAALPILYGDGTVSKKLVNGKTPIGVVFDEANRLAVALTDVKKDGTPGRETMYWANNKDYDIPNLENCTMESSYASTVVTCATDGRANTNKILTCGTGCGGTPAATAANSYQPSGCTASFCKKTKWWLPSMKELNSIYKVKVLMNSTLTFLGSLGAENLTDSGYWSSTEYSNNGAWRFSINSGERIWNSKSNLHYLVRPVVKY